MLKAEPKPTTLHRSLDSVQALRGIAATIVLLFHVAGRELTVGHGGFGLLHPFLFFGAQGVDLFFVISGFIITWTNYDSFGTTGKTANYFARRITRIFPLYWVFLVIALITVRLGFNHAPAQATSLGNLIGITFLLPLEFIHIVPVSWTLTYEFFFYCLFGLALRWDRRRFPLILAGWFLLAMVAAFSLSSRADTWFFFHRAAIVILNIRIIEFIFGCFIALCLRVHRLRMPALWFWLGTFIFAITAYCYSGLGPIPPSDLVLAFFGIGSAGIVAGAVGYEQSHGGCFVPRWLVALGDASYSLYLAHIFVIASLQRFLEPLNRPSLGPHLLWLALLLASGLAGGLLTFRLVEFPLLNAAGRGIRRYFPR